MRPEDIFFDAVTNIREELIEEAQRYVFRRRIHWQKYAGLAACLFLMLCAGWNLLSSFGGMGGSNSGSYDAGGAASPPSSEAPDAAAPVPDGESSFIADVLEIDGAYLTVVPLPGSGIWSVADRVTVPTCDVWDLPDIQPGDRVQVFYTGEAGDDFVEGVTEIQVLET